MEPKGYTEVLQKIEDFSSGIDYNKSEVAVVLAAGHGKRIRSRKSKMLHRIWGIPTVERVFNACNDVEGSMNSVLVVGIKASDVMDVVGKKDRLSYAYQAEQKGTGHAVQVGLERIDREKFDGTVFVMPGDMGLMNKETMQMFRDEFRNSNADMMVLTGIYEGPVEENSYGRIVRVKAEDADGKPSGEDEGKVIEIIEYKDILALGDEEEYQTEYGGRTYAFTRQELIENPEFNSGVYAFDFKKLVEKVFKIDDDNAQGEVYITDMISIFNRSGYMVAAISPETTDVVMGFNDKTVLKEMEHIYRSKIYDRLRNIVNIEDPEDFFIHENVVEDILSLDAEGTPLDIEIGKGVRIGRGVKLNYNITLKKNVFVEGNVIFGKNITIYENTYLSTYPSQNFFIGDNVEILWGDIIKGNITIGENSRIESSVNMTGSDEFPLRIGKNVLVKGTSYVFGSVIEDDVFIEHSVIVKKHIRRMVRHDGEVQKVRFYLPMPSGVDAIEKL